MKRLLLTLIVATSASSAWAIETEGSGRDSDDDQQSILCAWLGLNCDRPAPEPAQDEADQEDNG